MPQPISEGHTLVPEILKQCRDAPAFAASRLGMLEGFAGHAEQANIRVRAMAGVTCPTLQRPAELAESGRNGGGAPRALGHRLRSAHPAPSPRRSRRPTKARGQVVLAARGTE